MAIVFDCEGCGKGYEVADGLAGKKGRCKACGHTFRVPQPGEAAVDLYDLEEAAAEPEPAPIPSPMARAGRSSAVGSSRPLTPAKSNRVDAENQSQFRRVGIRLLIAGVLVFVLPFVGLQIKGLHLLGEGAQMAGGALMTVLGLACFGVSFTARPMRSMGYSVGGILGLIVLLVVIVGPSASRRRAAGPVPPPDLAANRPPGLPPQFAPPAPVVPPMPDHAGRPPIPAPPTAPVPAPFPAPQPPGLRPPGPASDDAAPLKVTISNLKLGPDERFPSVPNRMGVEFDYRIDEGEPPVRPLTLVLDSASTKGGHVPLVQLKPGGGHFAGHTLIPRADKGPFDCYLGVQKFGPGGPSYDPVSNVAKGEWGP